MGAMLNSRNEGLENVSHDEKWNCMVDPAVGGGSKVLSDNLDERPAGARPAHVYRYKLGTTTRFVQAE